MKQNNHERNIYWVISLRCNDVHILLHLADPLVFRTRRLRPVAKSESIRNTCILSRSKGILLIDLAAQKSR